MISVVIPTYQEEKYVENTLKALRNSDYKKKFEVIVADGGSKDRTLKIARKYADKVVVTGRGVAKGRNAGAAVAKGDVLLFVDADTMVMHNTLSEFERVFKDRRVVAATCPIVLTSWMYKDFMIYWELNQVVKLSITKAKIPHIVGSCFAARKSAFDEVGGFDETVETMEDFELSERLGKKGRVVFDEKTLVLTSPRRISRWGVVGTFLKSIRSYMNYRVTGKGVGADQYEPVR
jgi:glycosyltransferase involved in cell wall biosynthesis